MLLFKKNDKLIYYYSSTPQGLWFIANAIKKKPLFVICKYGQPPSKSHKTVKNLKNKKICRSLHSSVEV